MLSDTKSSARRLSLGACTCGVALGSVAGEWGELLEEL
jgi:hypothetical protein